MTVTLAKKPVFETLPNIRFALDDELGQRLQAYIEQWLLPMPLSNPAILTMFRDQDRLPLRNMVPWAGEFAGKYLTHTVQIYRLTHDRRLYELMSWFVKELMTLQAKDGYLGPWPKGCHLTGLAPNCFEAISSKETLPTWDAWGHYHIMLGMLLWYEISGDLKVLRSIRRIADLFCRNFLDGNQRLVSTGSEEMNLAPIHTLCLLYKKTGHARYLDLTHKIEQDFCIPPAGDYIRTALAGMEFFETPKPRWESLHCIQALAELYFITGQDDYRQALEHIWWSIVKLDRHNNGGFTSGEQAQGNPYHPGAIETCCTVSWMALSVDMLKITGNSIVADELELSMLNSGLGMMSPTGRWVSYNTPMNGTRIASPTDTTAFQARPGQPELNCCSVNGPRAIGLTVDWALMSDAEGLVLNYYGPGQISTKHNGIQIKLQQETDYPQTGTIILKVNLARKADFTLKLRIPHWSQHSRVKVNGRAVKGIKSGTYLALKRQWKTGDTVELRLDMSLHYWRGEKECSGLTSIYRGPILLTYDPGFDQWNAEKLPDLNAETLRCRKVRHKTWPMPWMLWEVSTANGQKMRLCDFASAGLAGHAYQSWLPVRHSPRGRFSHQNPLRTARSLPKTPK